MRPDIDRYADYRHYLSDMYDYCRGVDPGLSYREFSRRAGVGAPNALQRVLNGEKHLTADSAKKFAQGLGLTATERTQLIDLVRIKTTDNPQQRRALKDRLEQRRQREKTGSTSEDDLSLFLSKWYIVLVREVIALPNCPRYASDIRRLVGPRVTTKQVEEALSVLQKLKMIRFENDRWLQTKPTVETADDVQDKMALAYHRAMISLAGKCVDRLEPPDRELGGITATLSATKFADAVELLRRQRHEMFQFLTEESNRDHPCTDTTRVSGPAQVVQVNYQLFPLTVRQSDSGVADDLNT